MKVSIYDFDKTLYSGDSARDYALYCLRKRPWRIWAAVVFSIFCAGYYLGFINKETAKSRWYRMMDDREEMVEAFWARASEKLIKATASLARKDREDGIIPLVISAGPGVLIEGARKYMEDAVVIATETQPGCPSKFASSNCYGAEKVRRFMDWLTNQKTSMEETQIIRVVSDSPADNPLYDLGGKPCRIVDGSLTEGRPVR